MSKIIMRAFLSLAASAATATPLAGPESTFYSSSGAEELQPDDEPDGLFFSDGPFLVPNRSPIGDGNWIRFGTGECDVPTQVQSGRSMLRQSGFGDKLDEPEDYGIGAFDPESPWGMISDLFSLQPEIAVLIDGIEKSCDDEAPIADDPDPMSIA